MIAVKPLAWALAAGFLAMGAAAAQDALPEGHADAGANVYKKCLACHQVGPTAKPGVGPVLNGIVGRKAGTYAQYPYSPVNKNSGVVWDEATLAKYLPNPKAFMPGTKMTFVGLTKPQEVADVIAFLKQYDDAGNKK